MGRRVSAWACVAAAIAVASGVAAAVGCSAQGSPASPSWSGVELAEASVGGDASTPDAVSYTVCATNIEPKFSSLLTKVLDTSSCGTNRLNNCHSTAGSMGTGNLLAFDKDAGAVYAELILPDGGLVPSANLANKNFKPPRVVPGDAGASMLYIKLTLKTCTDQTYGCGMPYINPGSVCPAVLDAVKTWIDQGAAND
jgi:hypothetical protein